MIEQGKLPVEVEQALAEALSYVPEEKRKQLLDTILGHFGELYIRIEEMSGDLFEGGFCAHMDKLRESECERLRTECVACIMKGGE